MGKDLYVDAQLWSDGSPSHAGLVRGSSVAIHYPFFIGGQKLYPFRHGYWSTPKTNFGGFGGSPAGGQALAGPRLIEHVFVDSPGYPSTTRATMPTPLGSRAYSLSPVPDSFNIPDDLGFDNFTLSFSRSALDSRVGPFPDTTYPGFTAQGFSTYYAFEDEVILHVDLGIGSFTYKTDMALGTDGNYVYVTAFVDSIENVPPFNDEIRMLHVYKIHADTLTVAGHATYHMPELPYNQEYDAPEIRCTEHNVIVMLGLHTIALTQTSLSIVNVIQHADFAVFAPSTKIYRSAMHASSNVVVTTTLGSTEDPLLYTSSLLAFSDGSYEFGPYDYGINIDPGISAGSGTMDYTDTSPPSTIVRGGSQVRIDAINTNEGDVLEWELGSYGARGTGNRRGGGQSRLWLNGSLIATAGGGGGDGLRTQTGMNPGDDADGATGTPGAGGTTSVSGSTPGSSGATTLGGAPGDSTGGWGGNGRGGGGGGSGWLAGLRGRHGGSGGSWYAAIGGAKSIIPLQNPTSSQTPQNGLLDATIFKQGPNLPTWRHPTVLVMDENLNIITAQTYADLTVTGTPAALVAGEFPWAVTSISGEALAFILHVIGPAAVPPYSYQFDSWSVPGGARSTRVSPAFVAGMIYGDSFARGKMQHRVNRR